VRNYRMYQDGGRPLAVLIKERWSSSLSGPFFPSLSLLLYLFQDYGPESRAMTKADYTLYKSNSCLDYRILQQNGSKVN
jgi:hypothetical protein